MKKCGLKNSIVLATLVTGIWAIALSGAQAQTCANPTVLAFGVPESNLSTCGTGNTFDQYDACGNRFMNGDDYVLSYTPTVAGVNDCISININWADWQSRGLFIFDGCPDDPATTCIGQAIYYPDDGTIHNLQLTVGTTYIIVVSSTDGCYSFNISIGAGVCSPPPTGADCANAAVIDALPFSDTLSTCESDITFNQGNACFSAFLNGLNGEDYVFKYTPANNECIRITDINQTSNLNLYILNSCPTDPSAVCLAYGSGSTGGIPYVSLRAGKTYYIIAKSYPCTVFEIDIATVPCCGVGSTCYNPDAIISLPFTQTGKTTCGSCNDYNSHMACNNPAINGEDYVYSYTPVTNECIAIAITGIMKSNFPGNTLSIFNGCPEDITTSCVVQKISYEDRIDVPASLSAGQTYYFVISGIVCTPFNINITTGAAIDTGKICATSHFIPMLPFSKTGMTTACFENNYDPKTICGGSYNMNGEDFIFAYTSPGAETVNIKLNNTTGTTGLFVLDGCPDSPGVTCLGSSEVTWNKNNPQFPALCGFTFTNPGTYYIVVDGNTDFTDFDIDIQFPIGANCVNPYPVDFLPFKQSGLTTKCMLNDYNPKAACGVLNMNEEDFVFTYTSQGMENVNINLSNASGNVGLYVLDACPDNPAANCIVWNEGVGSASLCNMTFPSPGTYYILVDKFMSGFTNFDIAIEPVPLTGHECTNPHNIASIPYNQTGLTTKCYINDYTLNTICTGTAMNGEDYIFTYTASGTEIISIQLTNTLTDVGLFVLDNCPTSGGVNCIASAIGTNPALCSVSLTAPGTYYIIVDRNSSFTDFNINIEPIGQPGVDCSNPYTIPSIPFNKTGITTACYGNNYNDSNACANAYMNGDDFVFKYTTTVEECLHIAGSNLSGQGGVFIMDGCPDNPATTCVAQVLCTAPAGCDTVSVDVNFSPGTYYIVVSSNSATANLSFDLSVITNTLKPQIDSVGPSCLNEQVYLSAAPSGGIWSGVGIINSTNGTFNPTVAGIGIHNIIYTVGSCITDTIQIEVNDCGCNLDFERGDFVSWNAYTGACCPIIANTPDLVTGRHTIMTKGSTDPETNGLLPVVSPEGGNYSVRLGNNNVGREAEKLTHTFIVTPDNAIFGFRYAIVIQDGGHDSGSQARFEASMTDMAGDTIPCSVIDFVALNLGGTGLGQTLAGFQTIGSVQYKPWSMAVIDLRSYIGQIVTIEFRTGDCGIGAHFGYGYIDGICYGIEINGYNSCAEEDTIILSAPPGFMNYQWNTFPPQFTQSITVVNPQEGDSYSVEITPDPGAGCPVILTAVLNRFDNLIVTDAGVNDTICLGNSHTIAATMGGSAYHIAWETTGSGSFDNSSLLNATYTPSAADADTGIVGLIITAYDSAYACSRSDTMLLTITNDIAVSLVSQTNVTCNGGNDGSAIVAASGDYPPYTFSWSPEGGMSDTAVNLSADSYICTVTDSRGCANTETVDITEPDSISAIIFSSPANCGDNTGSASVLPNGGTPPYTYLWSPEAGGQETATATNLTPGAYTCTVTDSLSCSNAFNVAVNDSSDFAVSFSQVNVSCNGGNNGLAIVKAFGGSTPYTYSWSPVGDDNDTASNLNAGVYTVVVSDSINCRDSITITITEPEVLTLQTSGSDSICPGDSATLSAAGQGGTDPYILTWNPGSISSSSIIVSPDITTIYTVTVTDSNNCTLTQSLPLVIYPLPVVSFTADPYSGCVPLCVTFSNTTPNTNTANWEFGDGHMGSGSVINHCYPSPGTYSIKLAITDNNGCFNSLFAPDLINVFPNPIANFTMTPPYSAPLSTPVLFNDQSMGAVHWFWNFGDFLNSTSVLKNPVFTYNNLGSYIINLTVTSSEGCTDVIAREINIEPEFAIYIPNAFTPDGDGINDFFAPKGVGFDDVEMEIYSRWGERIYHTTDIDRPWNGMFKEEDRIVQDGVYVYKIWVKDFKDETHYFLGNVTLLGAEH